MGTNIILAGIGGQGVLFAHQVLAECAVTQGWQVTGAETHGMSQRGGSVVSHLKMGDSDAPLIRKGTADFLIAHDAGEAYRNLAFVRPGGTAIVNTALADFPDVRVRARLDALDITLAMFDADRAAQQLGRASVANLALLGYACHCENFPFTRAAVRETIARVAPARFAQIDLEAFDMGWQAGAPSWSWETPEQDAAASPVSQRQISST